MTAHRIKVAVGQFSEMTDDLLASAAQVGRQCPSGYLNMLQIAGGTHRQAADLEAWWRAAGTRQMCKRAGS